MWECWQKYKTDGLRLSGTHDEMLKAKILQRKMVHNRDSNRAQWENYPGIQRRKIGEV